MPSGQPFMHRTFKEIKIHTAKCDQCNKHNSATIYRCEDCSEQCCTPCWNQQGDDGKHLLNNALTVIIPASEAEKRKSTKKKTAKATKQSGKKTAITIQRVKKKTVPRKRKVVDDDDLDDTGDDIEMGDGPFDQVATAANRTTRFNKKQMKIPDLYEDSSDPDVKVGSISHSKNAIRQAMKPVGSRLPATPVVKGRASASKRQVQNNNDVAVEERYTTDDDSPVRHIPSKATSNISKESLKVSDANKRKRSGSSLEDQNTSRDHHSASSRKKARTGTPRDIGVAVDASFGPQSPANTEETEADIREHAKNLLLFAQGVQHSSPTPSPPISQTANPIDAKANTRSDLLDSNTARSSSPFADLPVWPPAPTTQTAAVSSTFPPSRDYYERAAARQAQKQASKTPAPRDGMWNRTWFPTDADDRAKANAEYDAGVKSGLAANGDAARPATNIETTEPSEILDQVPDLDNEEALQLKKAREAVADHAYRQTVRGQATAKEVVVIEVVETVTKRAETPMRKGIAHVKNAERATAESRTLEVVSA